MQLQTPKLTFSYDLLFVVFLCFFSQTAIPKKMSFHDIDDTDDTPHSVFLFLWILHSLSYCKNL